jgi:hypothetical protein
LLAHVRGRYGWGNEAMPDGGLLGVFLQHAAYQKVAALRLTAFSVLRLAVQPMEATRVAGY